MVEDEETDEELFEDEDAFAFLAERATKSTKENCQARFDGVFPPPKPDWAKNRSAEKGKTPAKASSGKVPAAPIPVEVHKPEFNPLDDQDIIMEDVPKASKQTTSAGKTAGEKTTK